MENRPIVIPILLEDVEVPPCLRGRLWIDFTDEARIDAHFDKLLAALGAAPIPARAATPAGRGVLQVTNALGGPILFLFARECGTQDWGIDRLPPDPVKGTIQPGDSTTLELSPGCWEMRVDHLATLAPGQLLTKATRLDPVLPGTRTSWLVVNPWR